MELARCCFVRIHSERIGILFGISGNKMANTSFRLTTVIVTMSL